ncbi:MAG: hypothetical protein ACYCV4_05425 [Dermatophilaceae bacterium]
MPSPTAQRVILPLKATVDTNGYCTFSWPPPPSGMITNATVTILTNQTSGTPPVWTLYLGAAPPAGDGNVPGNPIIATQGGSPAQIQQFAGEYLVAQASGLKSGDTYSATLAGVSDLSSMTDLQPPFANAQQSVSVPVATTATLTTATNTSYAFYTAPAGSAEQVVSVSFSVNLYNANAGTLGWTVNIGSASGQQVASGSFGSQGGATDSTYTGTAALTGIYLSPGQALYWVATNTAGGTLTISYAGSTSTWTTYHIP